MSTVESRLETRQQVLDEIRSADKFVLLTLDDIRG